MNKEELIKELQQLNINITEKQLEQIDIYYNFLIEYNNHTNLTTITEKDQFFLKHIFDSLTPTKVFDFEQSIEVLDVGTGAGFPGMVLKIIFPNLKITLLDSNNKKINFLKELTMKLQLKDVNFYHGRAEDFCQQKREYFDLVIARAVTNMTMLTELCLPLTKKDGYFIAMKGANQEEINESLYAIQLLGGKIKAREIFSLPNEGTRTLISIKKIQCTPKNYPRRYDKLKKNPLKNNEK